MYIHIEEEEDDEEEEEDGGAVHQRHPVKKTRQAEITIHRNVQACRGRSQHNSKSVTKIVTVSVFFLSARTWQRNVSVAGRLLQLMMDKVILS